MINEKSDMSTKHAAIDSGITTIDTAQYYLNSEFLIGKALKKVYRSCCFIATKASYDFSRTDIISAMENSLRALKTEYVDLYQIHNWDPKYPIEMRMDTMIRLQEQVKTRYIGVSNFNGEQRQKSLLVGEFHSNQLRYNMIHWQVEKKTIPFYEKQSIGVLVHSPLSKSLLTGKYTKEYQYPENDESAGFPRFHGKNFSSLP